MTKREFESVREGESVVEYHELPCVANEDLVKCVSQYDMELADEIQERFRYYFKELNWLWEQLQGK